MAKKTFDYYFTFGFGHYTTTGKHMKDCWVRITAESYSAARDYFREHVAKSLMGNPDKWSFQYEAHEFEKSKHFFPEGEFEHAVAS